LSSKALGTSAAEAPIHFSDNVNLPHPVRVIRMDNPTKTIALKGYVSRSSAKFIYLSQINKSIKQMQK